MKNTKKKELSMKSVHPFVLFLSVCSTYVHAFLNMLCTHFTQAYSIETDGRIISAVIVAYYMRYYPDAHTVGNIKSRSILLFRCNYSNICRTGAFELCTT